MQQEDEVQLKKKRGYLRRASAVESQFLDVAEAARFLGLSEWSVRTRIARGTLPYRKLRGRVLFLRRELEELVASSPGVTLAQARENVALASE